MELTAYGSVWRKDFTSGSFGNEFTFGSVWRRLVFLAVSEGAFTFRSVILLAVFRADYISGSV